MIEPAQVVEPEWLNVSRETMVLLERFVGLVQKWNPAINLVSRRSVQNLWDRHVLDSAQLFQLLPAGAGHLVDLGSGGGFPGIVLAIMAKNALPDMRVSLVEADQRKATFLAEVVRQLSLRAIVLAQRIEVVAPQNGDVVTARALAPLPSLVGLVHRHLGPGGIALILKGATVETELAEARSAWSFNLARLPSRTDSNSTVLSITDLRHV